MKKLTSKFLKKFPSNRACFLVILGLVVLFSLPFWLKARIPFSSTYLVNNFPPWQYYYGFPVKNPAMPDVSSQIFPWRYLSIEAFRVRQFPLWNPYNFSGTPLLANFQSAPFHLGNILFLLLPTTKAWSLLVLLPLLLAPLFTFWYLREIKMQPLAALVGGLGFGFCGFIVSWLAYGTLSWAILWLPLALLAIEKAGRVWWGGPLLSFSIAFSLFSGHFQISLYLLGAVFLYLLFRTRRKFLFVFFLLGIILALPQILPTVEFYQQSVRSQSFRPAGMIPSNYLITLLAPDFFGNPVTRNHWFGHYAEWASFIGVVPFLLGIYGIFFSKRNFIVRFFSFLLVVSLLVAVRSPIQQLIAKLQIPVLSNSAFSRIIVLYSFSMAILAAFGLEQLKKDWQKKKGKRIFFFLLVFALFFFLIWALIFLGRLSHSQIAKRNFILPSLMFSAAGFCFLAGLIKKEWWQKLLMIGLVFLAAFDLLRFAKKWLPFESPEYFYPRLEVIKFLEEKTNRGARVFGNFGGEIDVFKIPGLEGYSPLFIRRYGEFITTASKGNLGKPTVLTVYLDKNGEFTYPILNLLGVKYLLHAKEDGRNVWAFPYWQHPDDFELLWQDEKYEVHLNKKALPRSFLAYDYQVTDKDQEIIDLMLAAETDLSQTIILEEEPGLAIEVCQEKGRVVIEEYSPNIIKMKIESPCPGLLFLSDNFYPGWRAFVRPLANFGNAQRAKIYRANYSFRAIPVAAGEHQVSFVYQPFSFRIGLMVSATALVLLLGIIFLSQKE